MKRASVGMVVVALGLCGCAAERSERRAAGVASEPVSYEVAVVELPAPSAAQAARWTPIASGSLGHGAFLAHVTFSSHHGCSQSWASSSLTGTLKVELDGERVALELDLDQSTSSGSRHTPGSAHRDQHKLAGRWEGTGERGAAAGAFRARLTQSSCGEACAAEALEVSCERERIKLSGRADGADGAADENKAPSGGVLGIVCKGLRSAVPGSSFETLPLAPGVGVAVSSHGYGSELMVSFPRPAPMP